MLQAKRDYSGMVLPDYQPIQLEYSSVRIIHRSQPFLVWSNKIQKNEDLHEHLKNTLLKKSIVLNHWRDMIAELVAAGYTITRVSKMTGISRRSVQRWFNGTGEFTSPKLFSAVLCLYCYYKLGIEKPHRGTYAA